MKDLFADAWKQVLGRNYRFNNYRHTHYNGSPFGQYGSYELEPYLDFDITSLGMKRIVVEQPAGMGGPQAQNAPKQLWNEATQKRGAVEVAYCSVFGTMDSVVPYMTPDNWKGNSYLNAWNAYEMMNGMEIVSEMDFDKYPVFGQALRDRETIRTNKGDGIIMETGQLYKGDVPLIKLVAVMEYGHWNFMPAARVMWDFFKHYSRDPETMKLVYTP